MNTTNKLSTQIDLTPNITIHINNIFMDKCIALELDIKKLLIYYLERAFSKKLKKTSTYSELNNSCLKSFYKTLDEFLNHELYLEFTSKNEYDGIIIWDHSPFVAAHLLQQRKLTNHFLQVRSKQNLIAFRSHTGINNQSYTPLLELSALSTSKNISEIDSQPISFDIVLAGEMSTGEIINSVISTVKGTALDSDSLSLLETLTDVEDLNNNIDGCLDFIQECLWETEIDSEQLLENDYAFYIFDKIYIDSNFCGDTLLPLCFDDLDQILTDLYKTDTLGILIHQNSLLPDKNWPKNLHRIKPINQTIDSSLKLHFSRDSIYFNAASNYPYSFLPSLEAFEDLSFNNEKFIDFNNQKLDEIEHSITQLKWVPGSSFTNSNQPQKILFLDNTTENLWLKFLESRTLSASILSLSNLLIHLQKLESNHHNNEIFSRLNRFQLDNIGEHGLFGVNSNESKIITVLIDSDYVHPHALIRLLKQGYTNDENFVTFFIKRLNEVFPRLKNSFFLEKDELAKTHCLTPEQVKNLLEIPLLSKLIWISARKTPVQIGFSSEYANLSAYPSFICGLLLLPELSFTNQKDTSPIAEFVYALCFEFLNSVHVGNNAIPKSCKQILDNFFDIQKGESIFSIFISSVFCYLDKHYPDLELNFPGKEHYTNGPHYEEFINTFSSWIDVFTSELVLVEDLDDMDIFYIDEELCNY